MAIVGNEKYECDICETSFSEANAVKKHIHSVHDLKKQIHAKKKHICNLCIKEFQSAYKLTVHMECVHEGERKYRCVDCDKKYHT